MKKRDSFAKNKKIKMNKSKFSLRKKSYENKNSCSNKVSHFNLGENNKPNYLNQIDSNNIMNNINQANTNIYKPNNSYKNCSTVVHNATESGRISGNNSQYSTYTQSLKRKNNNLFNLEDNEKEEENDEMTIAVSKKGAQKNKVFFEFNPYDTELTNALFDKTLENYKKNRENQENRIKIVNYYEIFKNE